MVDLSFLLKKVDNERKSRNLGLVWVPYTVLSCLGVWPKHHDKYSMIRSFVNAVRFPLGFLITSTCHLVYAINLRPFVFKKCTVDICSLMGWSLCQYAVVMFIFKHKEIVEIMKTMSESAKYIHDIVLKDNILNLIGFVNLTGICLIGFCSYLAKLSEVCSDDDDTTCGLILTARLPWMNVNATPYRQMNLTVQTICGYTFAIMAYYCKWTMLCESEYLCSLIRHLKKELMLIPTLDGRESRKRHIKKCVINHYFIIKLWEKYTKATAIIYFPHLFATGIIMSVVALVIMIEFQFTMVLNFFMWWTNALICCLFGERLQNESLSLADVAYNAIPWDGDNETARDLLIIIIRSQKAMYIPAGKFGVLHLQHFMDIMKTTYSFLTLMGNYL